MNARLLALGGVAGLSVLIARGVPAVWLLVPAATVLGGAVVSGRIARGPSQAAAYAGGVITVAFLAETVAAMVGGIAAPEALLESLVPAAILGIWAALTAYIVLVATAMAAGHGRLVRASAAVAAAGLLCCAWVVVMGGSATADIQGYRVVNDRSLVVTVAVEPGAWLRLTGVTEAGDQVRVEFSGFRLVPPQAGALEVRQVQLELPFALQGRSVVNASGSPVPLVP